MVELLIVIVIIAVLIGLLAPAVSNAMRQGRITGVQAEIKQLDSAIAQFKAAHGLEPPSAIVLYETGTANAAAGTGWNSDANSRALIRSIWPQYNFAADRDINGDGAISTTGIKLTVGECLVFFLGGVNGSLTTGLSTTSMNNNPGYIGGSSGFSNDPSNPFGRGGTREAPLFAFNVARFTDVNKNGFPEYKDTLPSQKNPYVYYSSYDGLGYQETGAAAEFDTTASGLGLSAAYRQGLAITDPRWNANGHQIISPGFDNQYGYGGTYMSSGTTRLPLCPAIGSTPAPTGQMRTYEEDNITNFSQGLLQP